jgi:hypothetical protein
MQDYLVVIPLRSLPKTPLLLPLLYTNQPPELVFSTVELADILDVQLYDSS